MKRLLIMLLVAALTLMTAACGGSDGAASDSAATEASSETYDGFYNSYDADEYELDEAESQFEGGDEDRGTVSGSPALPSMGKSDVKLIYTANINVQTLDFDEAMKGLNSLVEKHDGYFESIESDNGSYYDNDGYRYGYYTVRVPSDKYQKFVNSLSEGMHVVNLNQSAQDVGQAYFETERRVETLKNKHDRLEELLKKAEKMKDIIELESALSDTEYELETYTSELKRYDSLIGYSTVHVTIEKVSQLTTGIEEELSFGQKLMRSVSSGLNSLEEGLENIIFWIGYYLAELVILAIVIVIIVKKVVPRMRRSGNSPDEKNSGSPIDSTNDNYDKNSMPKIDKSNEKPAEPIKDEKKE